MQLGLRCLCRGSLQVTCKKTTAAFDFFPSLFLPLPALAVQADLTVCHHYCLTTKPSDKPTSSVASSRPGFRFWVLGFYAARSTSSSFTALRIVFKQVSKLDFLRSNMHSPASAKPPCTSGSDIAIAQLIIFDTLTDATSRKKSSYETPPLSPASVVCLDVQAPTEMQRFFPCSS